MHMHFGIKFSDSNSFVLSISRAIFLQAQRKFYLMSCARIGYSSQTPPRPPDRNTFYHIEGHKTMITP